MQVYDQLIPAGQLLARLRRDGVDAGCILTVRFSRMSGAGRRYQVRHYARRLPQADTLRGMASYMIYRLRRDGRVAGSVTLVRDGADFVVEGPANLVTTAATE